MVEKFPDQSENYKKSKIRLGLIFGLIAGLTFTVITWGFDGFFLSRANAFFPWAKLVLGVVPIVALCIAAAWISSIFDNGLISLLVWLIFGGLVAFVGGHVSFEGLSLYYKLVDPQLAARLQYPVDSGIVTRLVMSIVICAAICAVAGLFFGTLLDNVFSTSSSAGALLVIALWMVFFAMAGIILNKMIEQPLRDPVIAINKVIDYRLQDETLPFSNDTARSLHLSSLIAIEDQLHSPRKLILLGYDSSQIMTTVGVDFSGTWVSCTVVADQSVDPPVQQPVFCKKME